MTKHLFRRVEEGIKSRRPMNGIKKVVAGAMVMAILPLQMLNSPAVSAPKMEKNSKAWQTQLVLADKTPDLLASPVAVNSVAIVKETSRYQEEVAKQEAEAKQKAALARQKQKTQVATPAVVTAHVTDVPYEQKVALAQRAAAAYGIPTSLLLAVWQVETGMRWNTPVKNPSGASGPFQFMPPTFRHYAKVDGNGDGVIRITDAEDAAYAAAHLLAANGANQGNYYRALFAYNHADWYVKKVLALANLS